MANHIPLSDIWPGDRLREDYGDLEGDIASLKESGQLQAILVRRPRDDEDSGGKPWVLVDGGRRFRMFNIIEEEGAEVKGIPSGHILANNRDAGTPLQVLQWEFQANENRKEFTWHERAKYVKKVHELGTQDAAEEGYEWSVYMTARLLRMSEAMIYKYLQLTQDPDLFEDPEVQKADSFNTAYKKHTIKKDRKRRIEEAKGQAEFVDRKLAEQQADRPAEERQDAETFWQTMATTLCRHGDARQLVQDVKDDSVDFIHWDPPYGLGGTGAYSSHDAYQDDWPYASNLMRTMFKEAFRILKDGHWMVVWHTPYHAEWVKRTLQGHIIGVGTRRQDEKAVICQGCGGLWEDLDDYTRCRASEHGLWVNPIPYIWHKIDRNADGHEIKRFSINQYEPFFLAAKWVNREPILTDSSTPNVIPHPIVPRAVRRHQSHKPAGLLEQILKLISVPGELGIDFGIGSGSIYEACLPNNRRILGFDLDEGNWATGVSVIKNQLRALGITDLKSLRDLTRPIKEEVSS